MLNTVQTQLNLNAESYPHRAGFIETSTSKDAADKIEISGRAQALRDKALFLLKHPMTAKDLAFIIGEDINSVRPRLTELKKQQKIEITGERRDGQHVMVAI